MLTDTLARSGSGTLAFTWQVFWSARTTLFLVSRKIRAVPFKPDKTVLTFGFCSVEGWSGEVKVSTSSVLRYLAVGSVDLVDHISQQDFLINSTAEFLVLGIFAHLQVVSSEGLIHTVVRRGKISFCATQRSTETHWEINSRISSFI